MDKQTEIQYGKIRQIRAPCNDYTNFIFDPRHHLLVYQGIHTGLLPQSHWGSDKAKSLFEYFRKRHNYLKSRGEIVPVRRGTADITLLDNLIRLTDLVGSNTDNETIDARIVKVYCEIFNDIWKPLPQE